MFSSKLHIHTQAAHEQHTSSTHPTRVHGVVVGGIPSRPGPYSAVLPVLLSGHVDRICLTFTSHVHTKRRVERIRERANCFLRHNRRLCERAGSSERSSVFVGFRNRQLHGCVLIDEGREGCRCDGRDYCPAVCRTTLFDMHSPFWIAKDDGFQRLEASTGNVTDGLSAL